jgi:hypothetical protein
MANSGIKVVLTLRKYVNGQATSETKANVATDPDYIAPYTDLDACPIGGGTTTTTSTTSTTTSTTTTLQQNFQSQYLSANCASDTGGPDVLYNTVYYTENATKSFYVPTNTNVDIVLTANWITGPEYISAYAKIEKSDSSIIEYQGQVLADSGTPIDSDSDLTFALTAGNYTITIFGIDCGSGSTFGGVTLTVSES